MTTNELGHGDAMDTVDAAFSSYCTFPIQDRRIGWTIEAAQRFAGYKGTSYCDAVDVLARKFTTEAEIAELPRRIARIHS